MHLAGCNRSIARPITLVRAYGKSFVSLLLAPWSSLYQWMLVWRRRHASLSFQRAVTSTKLTCADLARTHGEIEREMSVHKHLRASQIHSCEQSFLSPLALFIPPSSLPPVSSSPSTRPGKREGAHQHACKSARTRTYARTSYSSRFLSVHMHACVTRTNVFARHWRDSHQQVEPPAFRPPFQASPPSSFNPIPP